MQRNDGSRQPSTYLPTTRLPSADSPLFADNTTNQLESYRHQSLHYAYFKYGTIHQTSSCVLAETTYHGPCPPAHRMYLPSPARNDSQLVVYHLYLAPRLRPHRGVRSHHSTARCLICSESHMSELPHRGVRSHHSMAGCVICSESHMSELPHRGVRQNEKSNHLIHFPHRGRSHRTCRSYRTPVR